jgi:hypothetical protein
MKRSDRLSASASVAKARSIFSALVGNSPQNYHQGIQIAQIFVYGQTPVLAESRRRSMVVSDAEQKETRTIFVVAPAELTTEDVASISRISVLR